MTKKGEKSLQMIFGLFLLLIISLVVLSLFFKFTEKSSSSMSDASTQYFSKAAVEKAKQECETLCSETADINGVLEFCGKSQKIDYDGDKTLLQKVSKGKWDFCEDMVPCFILVDNCKDGAYNGEECRKYLLNPDFNRIDYFNKYYNYATTTNNFGTCGLNVVNADNTQNCANWIIKYHYDSNTLIPTNPLC